MAGDWIKFEVSTPDKPEVWDIANRLGIDPDAVVGKLLRVWGWFDQHTENGNAPSVTKLLLDRLVGVPNFCNSVVQCGWLSDDGTTLSIVKFERHNGETAKTRALTAKRVAKHKNKGNAEANASSNDGTVTKPLPKEDKREDIGEGKPSPKRARRPSTEKLDFSAWHDQPSPQVLADWAAMRKAKRAPASQTVVDDFGVQINLAVADGHTADECLRMCIVKGWQGFKYAWFKNEETKCLVGAAASQPARRNVLDSMQDRSWADDSIQGETQCVN